MLIKKFCSSRNCEVYIIKYVTSGLESSSLYYDDDDDDDSALSEDRSWRWLFVLRITTHDLNHRSTRPDEHGWAAKGPSHAGNGTWTTCPSLLSDNTPGADSSLQSYDYEASTLPMSHYIIASLYLVSINGCSHHICGVKQHWMAVHVL